MEIIIDNYEFDIKSIINVLTPKNSKDVPMTDLYSYRLQQLNLKKMKQI